MWRGHFCPRNLTTSTFDHSISKLSFRKSRVSDPKSVSCGFMMLTRTPVPCRKHYSRYEYRRRLPHYQRDDRPLFVTFRTRVGFELSPSARSLILQHCLQDNGRTIPLQAAVIMPDHVHFLFTAMRDAEGW